MQNNNNHFQLTTTTTRTATKLLVEIILRTSKEFKTPEPELETVNQI